MFDRRYHPTTKFPEIDDGDILELELPEGSVEHLFQVLDGSGNQVPFIVAFEDGVIDAGAGAPIETYFSITGPVARSTIFIQQNSGTDDLHVSWAYLYPKVR